MTTTTIQATGVQKLRAIESELNTVIMERKDEIHALLLSLLTGKHILLLGEPGTAKSLLTNLFTKHVTNASHFYYQVNEFTDPSEIFGPFSLAELEKNDRFLRKIDGKLPTAHVGFLDEIFKSNSPLQNSLLSVLNEGIFFNDGQAVNVPLRLFVGASNEIPLGDDSSGAFIDRLVQHFWVSPIQEGDNLIKMFKLQMAQQSYAPQTTVDLAEIDALRAEVAKVTVPDSIFQALIKIFTKLEMGIDLDPNGDNQAVIHISDRRKAAFIPLLQAEALLNNRTTVETQDLFVLYPAMIRAKSKKEYFQLKSALELEVLELISPYERELAKIVMEATNLLEKVNSIEADADKANAAIDARNSLSKMAQMVREVHNKAQRDGIDLIEQTQKAAATIDSINREIVEKCLFINDIFGKAFDGLNK